MTRARGDADPITLYDRVLAWLAGHSPATLNEIAAGTGVTRDRALACLRVAERRGDATRTPPPPPTTRRYPHHWSRAGVTA